SKILTGEARGVKRCPIPPLPSVSASPRRRPLTPPAPLSPRERGEKDQRKLLFFSLLSLGERRVRGGEGRRRGDAETEGNGGIGLLQIDHGLSGRGDRGR